MNYEQMFRDLIYGAPNWVAQAAASRLQQEWCKWKPEDREERLLFGHKNILGQDILGLANLAAGYPYARKIYEKYLNNKY